MHARINKDLLAKHKFKNPIKKNDGIVNLIKFRLKEKKKAEGTFIKRRVREKNVILSNEEIKH